MRHADPPRFWKQAPMLRALAALICGILFRSFGWPELSLPAFALSIAMVLPGIWIRQWSPVLLLGIGAVGYWSYVPESSTPWRDLGLTQTDTCVLQVLRSSPTANGYHAEVKARAHWKYGHWSSSDQRYMIYSKSSIEAGQLLFQVIESRPARAAPKPNAFSERKWLRSMGIERVAYVDSAIVVGHQASHNLMTHMARYQKRLAAVFEHHMKDTAAIGLAKALILGDRAMLSRDQKQLFQATGAMHVLAVSGLHVGMIYLMLSLLLRRLQKRRRNSWVTTVILLSGIWMYVGITGASPSATRAGIMFSFVVFGNSLRRETSIYSALATSAFVLLMMKPSLLFELGFLFSYGAVLGIVLLQGPIYRQCYVPGRLLKWIWGLISVSLVAQMAVAPLSLHHFGSFPTYFLLSNFIAIPMATLVVYGGVFTLLLAPFPAVCTVAAALLERIIVTGIAALSMLAEWPMATLTDAYISARVMLLLYGLLIVLTAWIILGRRRYGIWTLSMAIASAATVYIEPAAKPMAWAGHDGLMLNTTSELNPRDAWHSYAPRSDTIIRSHAVIFIPPHSKVRPVGLDPKGLRIVVLAPQWSRREVEWMAWAQKHQLRVHHLAFDGAYFGSSSLLDK